MESGAEQRQLVHLFKLRYTERKVMDMMTPSAIWGDGGDTWNPVHPNLIEQGQ